MKDEELNPGVIVEVTRPEISGIEWKGEEGILIRKEKKPDVSWLEEQHDKRWRDFQQASWWAVMPLSGGLLLVPEPLLRVLRPASYNDIMKAVDHANNAGRQTIALLFPDVIEKLLRARSRGTL